MTMENEREIENATATETTVRRDAPVMHGRNMEIALEAKIVLGHGHKLINTQKPFPGDRLEDDKKGEDALENP